MKFSKDNVVQFSKAKDQKIKALSNGESLKMYIMEMTIGLLANNSLSELEKKKFFRRISVLIEEECKSKYDLLALQSRTIEIGSDEIE